MTASQLPCNYWYVASEFSDCAELHEFVAEALDLYFALVQELEEVFFCTASHVNIIHDHNLVLDCHKALLPGLWHSSGCMKDGASFC